MNRYLSTETGHEQKTRDLVHKQLAIKQLQENEQDLVKRKLLRIPQLMGEISEASPGEVGRDLELYKETKRPERRGDSFKIKRL